MGQKQSLIVGNFPKNSLIRINPQILGLDQRNVNYHLNIENNLNFLHSEIVYIMQG